MTLSGGRFDFNDGGTYCGGWEAGRAHGHGICTGPNGQGEFAGSWSHGFEVIGVYTWPSGNTYDGNWSLGKRHGLGVETKGRWQYKGEWTHGFKGRYGVRSSTASRARYEGTWSNGLQDGYGTETYADEGTYQGQWLGGMRHGYGVRQSAPYGMASCVQIPIRASRNSLRSDHSGTEALNSTGNSTTDGHARGGFVLGNRSNIAFTPSTSKKKGFLRSGAGTFRRTFSTRLRKRSKSNTSIASNVSQTSSVKSGRSFISDYTGSSMTSSGDYASSSYGDFDTTNDSFHLSTIEDDVDVNAVETYCGQWRNDKRDGFGVCERSDGFKYQGEWLDNQRHGYGCTVFPDGSVEEGKYKQNILIASRRKVLGVKTGKVKEKVDSSVKQAVKVAEVARQKAEIAISRTGHGIAKAEQAELTSQHAKEEGKIARCVARDLAPDFHQPGLSHLLAKGEDPFRELDHLEDYNVDREGIGGVAGPDSYRQYSDAKNDGSSVKKESIDQTGKDLRTPSPSPSDRRKSSSKRLSIFGSKHKLEEDAASIVTPSPGHVSPSPNRKENLLSPDDAAQSQSESPLPSIVVATDSRKTVPYECNTPSPSLNSNRSSGHNVKHGFFRSLLHKPKKSATLSNSKSPDSAFAPAKEDFVNADKDSWDQRTAESKRTLWKKSVSSPERNFVHLSVDREGHNKTNGLAATEDGLREKFIANYENEMFTPLKAVSNSSESRSEHELSHSEVQSRTRKRDGATAENTHANPEIQITVAETQGALPPEISVTSDASQKDEGNKLETNRLVKSPNNATTNETADLISPAFANYNTRESSEASDINARRRLRDAYLRKQRTEEPHVNEYASTRKYSPLPTRLRHDAKSSFAQVDQAVQPSKSKSDTSNSIVVTLVVILILGFAAVFTQVLA